MNHGILLEVTLIGGLMTGMLYSLVALGFVLIFKASGVFNFAQGAMVLFAALAMARFRVDSRSWTGPGEQVCWPTCWPLRRDGVMIVLAWVIERLVLGKLVNQEGITLLMATLGITYFLDGLGPDVFGSDIYKIDVGMPKDPIFLFEKAPSRAAFWSARKTWLPRSWRRAGAVLALFFQYTAPAARCARWPTTTRPRSRSASR
jgi:branched-chain amino acid transport system permease protein